MHNQVEMEIKVGLFVSIGLGLIMLAIILLGGSQSYFATHKTYFVHVSDGGGVIKGAKVVLNGIPVGMVKNILFDRKSQDIRIDLNIEEEYAEWIREDATAEISTQGVLGDKYIAVQGGSLEKGILRENSVLKVETSGGIKQIFTKSESLVESLGSVANGLDKMLKAFEREKRQDIFFQGLATTASNLGKATKQLNDELKDIKLKESLESLNSILGKIDKGKGSLGALINDPALYDDVKSLVGGANRNRVMRNLVRKTIKDAEAQE